MLDTTAYPTIALYSLLGLLIGGFGVGMLVWQTGATEDALVKRRSMIVGGVLLILIAALVIGTQIYALVINSYG